MNETRSTPSAPGAGGALIGWHRVVDVHSHALPAQALEQMQALSAEHAPYLEPLGDGSAAVVRMGDVRYEPFPKGGWDVERRIREMDRRGIDVQVVSPVPFTYAYELELELGSAFARAQNDALSEWVGAYPERLVALATLPMQDPRAAAAELKRAIRDLGLRGAILGTHVRGKNLDAPELEPVWEAAESCGAFLLLHPWTIAGSERLREYYLTNVVGNPFETTTAAAALVLGGVMRRFPGLTICLPHGGGFLPFQRGRLEHAWQVQPQARRLLGDDPPGPYLDRFYADSILFSREALTFLVRTQPADHVLLGSDYPFGMGLDDPVAAIAGIPYLGEHERDGILGGNAARLLGLASTTPLTLRA